MSVCNVLSLSDGDEPGICLGDGQMKAPGVPVESGRGDTLWRLLPMNELMNFSSHIVTSNASALLLPRYCPHPWQVRDEMMPQARVVFKAPSPFVQNVNTL